MKTRLYAQDGCILTNAKQSLLNHRANFHVTWYVAFGTPVHHCENDDPMLIRSQMSVYRDHWSSGYAC